jgi:hypothetical protein
MSPFRPRAFGARHLAWRSKLPDGRPKILGAFAQAMKQAAAWEAHSTNPVVAGCTGKRRVAKRRDIVPFTRDEVDRIAVELGSRLGPLVVFMSETGLRPAEAAALEWRGRRPTKQRHPSAACRYGRGCQRRGGCGARETPFRHVTTKTRDVQVERTGIEPVTSGLQSRRSPS